MKIMHKAYSVFVGVKSPKPTVNMIVVAQ
jgi:hypothetical protein